MAITAFGSGLSLEGFVACLPGRENSAPRNPQGAELLCVSSDPPRQTVSTYMLAVAPAAPVVYGVKISKNAGNTAMEARGNGYLADEPTARMGALALRDGPASQSSPDAAREPDDGFDFPPIAYSGRELFTGSLFVLLIRAIAVWGSWKLMSLVLTS
jgi:hypothetical protein